ncbi:segregation and condensation protein A [Gemmatimonadota bacterium]
MDLTPIGSPLKPESLFVVELDRFQGPLDLLLHLVRQQDIDIFDIPISSITDKFLAAVEGIDAERLDSAGEFLEMAATLVRIKAQMLLPRYGDDEDEDPRAELVRRLLEYEQTREISTRLAVAEADRARRFGKGFIEPRPRPEPVDTPLETLWDEVMEVAVELILPDRHVHPHRVMTRLVPMEDKIQLILDSLRNATRVEFKELIKPWTNRMHGVMTLLAGLELSRRRAVWLRQAQPFSDLWLLRGEVEDYDVLMSEITELRSMEDQPGPEGESAN